MNIYVGNLSPEITEDDLRQAFEAFGQVSSVKIVKDGATGESRGFGFVAMPSTTDGQTAIEQMNGKDFEGQTIKVEEGRTKTKPRVGGRRPGGFGDGGRGGKRGGFGGRSRNRRRY